LCVLKIWDNMVEGKLNTQSSSEYSGLISFRIDWFDLLAVQGTLKSLLEGTEAIKRFF